MEERVRAALRLRPVDRAAERSLRVEGDEVIVKARGGNGQLSHRLDKVFGEDASQSEVFEWVTPAVADVARRGVHATIFAYGQTGTGKTHTMMGDIGEGGLGDRAGIIPRAAAALFETLGAGAAAMSIVRSTVHCSYMQIYGDRVMDMLADGRSGSLAVRETPFSGGARGSSKSIFVQGLSEYQVTSAGDVLSLVARGDAARATRATDHNAQSRRAAARAVVIATASAAASASDETNSTLAFAQRATRVTATLRFDEVVNDGLLLKKAQREISRLRRQLQRCQTSTPSPLSSPPAPLLARTCPPGVARTASLGDLGAPARKASDPDPALHDQFSAARAEPWRLKPAAAAFRAAAAGCGAPAARGPAAEAPKTAADGDRGAGAVRAVAVAARRRRGSAAAAAPRDGLPPAALDRPAPRPASPVAPAPAAAPDRTAVSTPDDDDAGPAERSPPRDRVPDGRMADASAAKLAALLLEYEADGMSLEACFDAIDADGSGLITAQELWDGLTSLGDAFEDLTRADVWRVIFSIDEDKNGSIDKAELAAFVARFRAVREPPRDAPRDDAAADDRTARSAERLARLLGDLEAQGVPLATVFATIDANANGFITATELYAGLKSQGPAFADLTVADAWRLVRTIDLDRNGSVDLPELEAFVAKFRAETPPTKGSSQSGSLIEDEYSAQTTAVPGHDGTPASSQGASSDARSEELPELPKAPETPSDLGDDAPHAGDDGGDAPYDFDFESEHSKGFASPRPKGVGFAGLGDDAPESPARRRLRMTPSRSVGFADDAPARGVGFADDAPARSVGFAEPARSVGFADDAPAKRRLRSRRSVGFADEAAPRKAVGFAGVDVDDAPRKPRRRAGTPRRAPEPEPDPFGAASGRWPPRRAEAERGLRAARRRRRAEAAPAARDAEAARAGHAARAPPDAEPAMARLGTPRGVPFGADPFGGGDDDDDDGDGVDDDVPFEESALWPPSSAAPSEPRPVDEELDAEPSGDYEDDFLEHARARYEASAASPKAAASPPSPEEPRSERRPLTPWATGRPARAPPRPTPRRRPTPSRAARATRASRRCRRRASGGATRPRRSGAGCGGGGGDAAAADGDAARRGDAAAADGVAAADGAAAAAAADLGAQALPLRRRRAVCNRHGLKDCFLCSLQLGGAKGGFSPPRDARARRSPGRRALLAARRRGLHPARARAKKGPKPAAKGLGGAGGRPKPRASNPYAAGARGRKRGEPAKALRLKRALTFEEQTLGSTDEEITPSNALRAANRLLRQKPTNRPEFDARLVR
ncbi:hypothetical protein JL720_8472 [Aureococcus anophagefferens]|nr:hypothetical protein JL720_8472 [Aureococcus anophagefferens]